MATGYHRTSSDYVTTGMTCLTTGSYDASKTNKQAKQNKQKKTQAIKKKIKNQQPVLTWLPMFECLLIPWVNFSLLVIIRCAQIRIKMFFQMILIWYL